MSKKTKEMDDQLWGMVKSIYKKSGADIGPPKPLSDEMLKKIQQGVDNANKKKFAKGGTMKYAHGGSVSRGCGAATKGTKFKGVM